MLKKILILFLIFSMFSITKGTNNVKAEEVFKYVSIDNNDFNFKVNTINSFNKDYLDVIYVGYKVYDEIYGTDSMAWISNNEYLEFKPKSVKQSKDGELNIYEITVSKKDMAKLKRGDYYFNPYFFIPINTDDKDYQIIKNRDPKNIYPEDYKELNEYVFYVEELCNREDYRCMIQYKDGKYYDEYSTFANVRVIADFNFGFYLENNKFYWYENGIKQGIYGSPGNVWYEEIERGREIYDPESDGWYWLDALYDGAKAVNKEVFMPYVYSNEKGFDEATINSLAEESNTYTENYGPVANMGEQVKKAIKEGTGKWVRYDLQGKMYKGWYVVQGSEADIYTDQIGNTYYYDFKTGLMAKGLTIIDGIEYYFDETTGVLQQ